MNAATTSAMRWSISARTAGEVLIARAALPAIELVQLGVPSGFTPPEIEGWLRDLAGVAGETSRGDTRSRGIPALLHHALTGLLFSQAELWNLNEKALPCSIAFVESPEGAAFGWVGAAHVQVFRDDLPVEPQWVIVRDDGGREARAAMLPAGARARVAFEFRGDETNRPGTGAFLEAEWIAEALAAPAATESVGNPPALPDELEAVAQPIESAFAPAHEPALPESLPTQQPGLAAWDEAAAEARAAGAPAFESAPLDAASTEWPNAAEETHAGASPVEAGNFVRRPPIVPEAGAHPVARWLGRVLGWARRAPRPEPTFADPPFSEPAATEPPVSAYDELIAEPTAPTLPVAPEPVAAPAPASPGLEPESAPAAPTRAAVVARMNEADASALPVLSVPLPVAQPAPLHVEHEPVGADSQFAIAPLPRRDPSAPIVVRAPAIDPTPVAPAAPPPVVATRNVPPTPAPIVERPPATSVGYAPSPGAPAAAAPAPAPPAVPAPSTPTSLRVAPAGQVSGPPVLRVAVPGRAPEAPPVLRVAPAPGPAPSAPMQLEPLQAAASRPAPEAPPAAPTVPAAVEPVLAAPRIARAAVEPALAPPPIAQGAAEPAYVSAAPEPTPSNLASPVRDVAPPTVRRAPRAWPVAPEPRRSRGSRRTPWIWAAVIVIAAVFGVGWLLGTGGTSTTDDPGPLARLVRAIGLGPPRFVAQITSTPPGAWIAVDGKDAARRTPAEVELAPGEHSLTLTLPDLGNASTTVRGERNARVGVDVPLEGALEIEAADPNVPVTVALDGRAIGYAPVRMDSVLPGLHELQFSGPGMPAWAQSIEVGVHRTAQIVARPISAPSDGVIQVQASQSDEQGTAPLAGAQVWVDGELKGVTPTSLELPRGPHSLKLTWHGETAPVQVIDLPGGNQRFASFSFGVDSSPTRIVLLGGVHPTSADQTSVVAASVDGLAPQDVREAWLHVRGPEDLWRRYAATVLSGGAGSVLVCVFPPGVFDAQGQTRWYLSASTPQGDEYFTEMQTASLAHAPASAASASGATTTLRRPAQR